MSEKEMTIREALLAMGYQERKPGHWLKPIGYQCFSYHEGRNEWANWFTTAVTGEVSLMERKFISDNTEKHGSYLHQLKEWECWTKKDINTKSTFELGIPDL